MLNMKKPDGPIEKPKPEKYPEKAGPDKEDPEYPLSPEQVLDIIPDNEDPFKTPPYEPSPPGEGP